MQSNTRVCVCVCVCVRAQRCAECVRADQVCVGVAAVWISQVGNTPVCVIRDFSPTLSAQTVTVRRIYSDSLIVF